MRLPCCGRDWGTQWWSGDDAVMMLVGDSSLTLPRYRARLTALSRYGIRAILAGEGHIARVADDLAAEDAGTLLDVLQYYEPDAFSAELTGWLAGRAATQNRVQRHAPKGDKPSA
jgi:hypothetical protein